MRQLSIILVLGLFLPVFGWADANSCLRSMKEDAVSKPLMAGPMLAAQLGTTVAALKNLPRRNESFRRSVGLVRLRNEDLSYRYDLAVGGNVLTVEHTFEANEAYNSGAFTYSLKYFGQDKYGRPLIDYILALEISAECGQRLSSRETTYYRMVGDDKVEVVYSLHETGKSAKTLKVVTGAKAIEQGHQILRLRSAQQGEKQGFTPGLEFPITLITDGELAHYNIAVESTPPLRRRDPLAGRIEILNGLKIRAESLSFTYYDSPASDYSILVTDSGYDTTIDETVTHQMWTEETLEKRAGGGLRIVGFTDQDWLVDSLEFNIVSPNLKALHNSSAYWESVVTIPGGVRVRNKKVLKPEGAVAWDAPTEAADREYLKFSKYIQREPVQIIADQLRPQLAGKSRSEAARLIAVKVNELITYDDAALENNLVNIRTTEEVLRDKKGVCQHFAAVFVSIARALGIPARVISGVKLYSDQSIHHAWVEVKIDRERWWPLEPQLELEALPSHQYIPSGISKNYEIPDGPNFASELLKANLESNKNHAQFNDAIVRKN